MAGRFHLRCATLFRASPEEVWALKTDWKKMQDEFLPLFRGKAPRASVLGRRCSRGSFQCTTRSTCEGLGSCPWASGKWK